MKISLPSGGYQDVVEFLRNYVNIPTAHEALQRAFQELPRPEMRQLYTNFDPDEIIKRIIAHMTRPPVAGGASTS